MALFRIAKVTYAPGEETILDDIDFSVQSGEILSIIGGSGSGKSTILKLCISSINPTTGKIMFNDLNLANADKAALMAFRRRTGFVFDLAGIINNMNIYDNLALPLRYHTQMKEKDIEENVLRAMDGFNIRHLCSHFPISLSHSEEKIVNFIRAFMGNPEVIFYDEPFFGLDQTVCENIITRMEQHQKNKIIQIICTGSIRSSLRVADKIGLLKKGRIIEFIDRPAFKNKDDAYIRERLYPTDCGRSAISRH